ncbi:MAG: hypothetical protein JWP15_1919 [Alphaproteobacteria bacterium]|nr:hypothetical protein [Alphaproteobacteria bacterium]
MSTEIRGTGIRSVAGALVTDDGRNVLLRLNPIVGPEMILALPASQLGNLMMMAAQSSSEAKRRRGDNPDVKEAFIVEDWRIDIEPQDRVLVLTLILAGETEVSFRLPTGVQQAMIDTLAATVAPPPADSDQIN